MSILVINAGSSSIKFSLFADDTTLRYKGQVDGVYTAPRFVAKDASDEKVAQADLPAGNHDSALRHILAWLDEYTGGQKPKVIGHRVVHGGTAFAKPAVVTPEVIEALRALTPLAPLHQPHNVKPIEVLAELLPDVPQVVCFDTAFHTTQPELNQLYALPYELAEREGIRRYGFHGLSYDYIASVLPEIDTKAAEGRTVVAHLGNGASLAALNASKSWASTMGFTALEGLPMGTRSGSIDAGVVLHCFNHLKMTVGEVEKLLYQQSGLLGLSGLSNDMRALRESDDVRAKLATDFFVSKIVRETLSLAGALEGLDALVFTAGIGENDAQTRRDVCRQLRWLGVELDEATNAQRSSEARRISLPDSSVAVYVIPTNEELMIARHALAALA
ncbi:acetate/propionate family kinase [Chitinibacteraceae bacterium HSL-7]